MCSREKKIANEIKEEFCRRVIPSHIIRYLKCITTQDTEKVQAVEKQNGPVYAAEILLERLVRRPDWLYDLKRVFLIQDVGLLDFGEKLEEKCRQLSVTVGAIEECIDGHGFGEKEEQTLVKSPPTDEMKLCTREEEIANEIKDEFCSRVIPSGIITYLKCLTIQDTEKVQAVEKQFGAISAAEILLDRLVRRPDWLHDLKRVFLNQDVGLLDFGEQLEEKCRQLNVMKSTSTDKSTSSVAIIDRQESLADIRSRGMWKQNMYDKVFQSIKHKDDIPEIMNYAHQIITDMDEHIYGEKKNIPANVAIIDDYRDLTKEQVSLIQDTSIHVDPDDKNPTIIQQTEKKSNPANVAIIDDYRDLTKEQVSLIQDTSIHVDPDDKNPTIIQQSDYFVAEHIVQDSDILCF